MTAPLRILHLEDDPADARLVRDTLAATDLAVEITTVATRVDFLAALDRGGFDLILADYRLPTFDGLEALALLRERSRFLPFVFLTGVLGEERAIESLKRGATDYVLKDRLTRLVPVIRRALDEADEYLRRQQAEQALRESQERLALAASAAQIGMFEWSEVTGQLLWTPQHEVLFGYPATISPTTTTIRTYRDWADRVHPDDLPAVEARIERCMRERSPYLAQYRVVWPDGSVHWMEARGLPDGNAEGRATRMRGTVTDITERKRADEALLQAKALAEEANEAKSQFLANISHELRTPMNAILGMIDLAFQKQTDPTARDLLQTARESAAVLLALLHDLLDCAKIESGKMEIESEPFGLRRVLDQTTQVLAVRATEKGVSFSCSIPSDVPDALIGDQIRLRQVLMNLAGNAIKFTELGEVTVSVRVQSQEAEAVCLEFAVRDTGIGIPRSQLEKVFQPFAQADASTSRRFGGTGLGLSISSNLVALMGGRMWVESELGQGSTFYFTVHLPLATHVPPELESANRVLPAAPSLLRVLLVEDNPANQKLASLILQERGHAVDIATNGRQGIEMSGRKPYDVILMDVQMPGMDGLAATRAIRAREQGPRRVPIIAMTAHAMKGDRERCLAAGMNGYLSKPVDGHEMIAQIESLAEEVAQNDFAPTRGEPATVPAASVFDPRLAMERCLNQQDMLGEIIQCFLGELESLFPQIHAALQRGDLAEVGRLAHRLRGTVVYLGADATREAALRVERFETHNGEKTAAEMAVKALEQSCEQLKAALLNHAKLSAADANTAPQG